MKSFSEEIKQMLHSPKEVGRDYFESPEVYEQEILTGRKWEVTKYGILKMDEHAPYKQGQLTTIIGHTNVGKTTLILFLMAQLLKQGKKLIVYSAENRISQIGRYLIAFAHGNHEYRRYFPWLRERVMFIRHARQFDYRDMLEQAAIADDMGFKSDMIFIDPYNALKIPSHGNSHNYHYEAIEDFRIFTMQSGKSIFLNCHTVTDAQREKPNAQGEIRPPLMADVEGGGKFPNKSDDVWVIHRDLYHIDKNERYVSQLFIGKVRNTEGGGHPTGMRDPIRFTFRRDWTGFDQEYDGIARQQREINDWTRPKNEPNEF